jgi:hypothetical protein
MMDVGRGNAQVECQVYYGGDRIDWKKPRGTVATIMCDFPHIPERPELAGTGS